MSNRAKELSTAIVNELRDAIGAIHDKLIHLAFLHNPRITDAQAIEQANKDIAEMLLFYVKKFAPDEEEGKE